MPNRTEGVDDDRWNLVRTELSGDSGTRLPLGGSVHKSVEVIADDVCSGDVRTRRGAIRRSSLPTDKLDYATNQGHVDQSRDMVLAEKAKDVSTKLGHRQRKVVGHDSDFQNSQGSRKW